MDDYVDDQGRMWGWRTWISRRVPDVFKWKGGWFVVKRGLSPSIRGAPITQWPGTADPTPEDADA